MPASEFRPLPARPDLESERKRAKQLLRDVRRADPAALTRITGQNRSLASSPPESIKLADAQLTIAREYGFKSWPLLVRYYEKLDLHRRSGIRLNHGQGREDFERASEVLLQEHQRRRHSAAMGLGSFAPRFYGMRLEEIFATEATLDDAKLVVARRNGCASWDELLETAEREKPDPWRDADPAYRETLFGKETLEMKLLGRMHMQPEQVEQLLAEGADPEWIAPNGYTVLEHAIYRYWNGEAVDVLAGKVMPRDLPFVAAGLGDAARLKRFFGRDGKLTARARNERPDLMSLTRHGGPDLPDPGDEFLLWELAFAAAVNGRSATFDILLERGFSIDFSFGMTLLAFAAGNGLLPMVELLVARGASPHVRGYQPAMTALELAASMLGHRPADATKRRIVDLLGGDADTIAREADAKRARPQLNVDLSRAIAFAMEDAARSGQANVGVENLLVGIICDDIGGTVLACLAACGVDLAKLRARYEHRFLKTSTFLAALPYDRALRAAMDLAIAHAVQRRDPVATWAVLSFALEPADNPLAPIIREFGGDVQKVKDRLGEYLR